MQTISTNLINTPLVIEQPFFDNLVSAGGLASILVFSSVLVYIVVIGMITKFKNFLVSMLAVTSLYLGIFGSLTIFNYILLENTILFDMILAFVLVFTCSATFFERPVHNLLSLITIFTIVGGLLIVIGVDRTIILFSFLYAGAAVICCQFTLYFILAIAFSFSIIFLQIAKEIIYDKVFYFNLTFLQRLALFELAAYTFLSNLLQKIREYARCKGFTLKPLPPVYTVEQLRPLSQEKRDAVLTMQLREACRVLTPENLDPSSLEYQKGKAAYKVIEKQYRVAYCNASLADDKKFAWEQQELKNLRAQRLLADERHALLQAKYAEEYKQSFGVKFDAISNEDKFHYLVWAAIIGVLTWGIYEAFTNPAQSKASTKPSSEVTSSNPSSLKVDTTPETALDKEYIISRASMEEHFHQKDAAFHAALAAEHAERDARRASEEADFLDALNLAAKKQADLEQANLEEWYKQWDSNFWSTDNLLPGEEIPASVSTDLPSTAAIPPVSDASKGLLDDANISELERVVSKIDYSDPHTSLVVILLLSIALPALHFRSRLRDFINKISGRK